MSEQIQLVKVPPKHCPFCGCTELLNNFWETDEGEEDAYECSECYSGALVKVWNRRVRETR